MKRRIALAGVTFHRLWEKIFTSREISLAIILRLLNAAVKPILLYGSETLSLTTVMENKLNACENRWLRRILPIKYTSCLLSPLPSPEGTSSVLQVSIVVVGST